MSDRNQIKNQESSQKIVFTGGGSGGHTMTAMAVLDELMKKYPDVSDRVVYVGGNLAMEGEKKQS